MFHKEPKSQAPSPKPLLPHTQFKEFPIERRPFREGFRPQKTRVNHEIRLSPIRLVDQHNNQVGVVDTRDAMRMAEEASMDLVEIQADVRPPVCKIMDYGKFRFEQGKKDRANRAASKTQEMKEVRLGRSAKIDEHDVHIRVEQARGFLMEGHKVQFVQNFKGREMAHRDIGEDRLKEIIGTLNDIAKVEAPMKLFGKKLTMIMAPDKVKIEAIKRKMDKEKAATGGGPAKAAAPTEPAAAAPSAPVTQPNAETKPKVPAVPAPAPRPAPSAAPAPAAAAVKGPTPAGPATRPQTSPAPAR
ncbi:MAG: translation initiation factor IF-3 [Phycisphaerales bacterium]